MEHIYAVLIIVMTEPSDQSDSSIQQHCIKNYKKKTNYIQKFNTALKPSLMQCKWTKLNGNLRSKGVKNKDLSHHTCLLFSLCRHDLFSLINSSRDVWIFLSERCCFQLWLHINHSYKFKTFESCILINRLKSLDVWNIIVSIAVRKNSCKRERGKDYGWLDPMRLYSQRWNWIQNLFRISGQRSRQFSICAWPHFSFISVFFRDDRDRNESLIVLGLSVPSQKEIIRFWCCAMASWGNRNAPDYFVVVVAP